MLSRKYIGQLALQALARILHHQLAKNVTELSNDRFGKNPL